MQNEQFVSGHKSKEDEQGAAKKINRAVRDLASNHVSGKNCSSGADGVADDAAEGDAVGVLGRGEGDGGDLRAVAPLGDEGEGEGLDEDGAHGRGQHIAGARLDVALLGPERGGGLGAFVVAVAFLALLLLVERVAEDLDAEADEEEDGKGLGEADGEQGGHDDAHQRGEHGHGRERGDGAGEDDEAGVAHGHEAGDEEGLVADLGDEDHGP